MIRALIIDDEASGRETLCLVLEHFKDQVQVIATAASVAQGRTMIDREKPDLVFLDIEMPNESGFDLLRHYENPAFSVVFVTAYNQYALKAFEFAALDYLLKPVNLDKLERALNRAEKATAREVISPQQMEVFEGHLQQPSSQENRCALPSSKGIAFIPIKTMVRIKANDHFSEVYLDSGKRVLVSLKVSRLEELLKGYRFYRIHRSHLINLNHLVHYHKGRTAEVELTDGSFLELARRKKEEFLQVITQ